jgi:hypothetical protein
MEFTAIAGRAKRPLPEGTVRATPTATFDSRSSASSSLPNPALCANPQTAFGASYGATGAH